MILHSLSAKRTSWNEFSSAMASALICLSSGQRFNFSKYIFESLVRNVDSSSKFYMYPCFIQLIIQTNIDDLSKHTNRYISPVLTQKVFANMRRVGKGFSGVETPLFETMLAVRDITKEAEAQVPAQVDDVHEHVAEEVANDVVPPTPTSPSPSSPVLNTCSALVLRVEGLDNANAAQQLEIVKLKARVKKLERLNKGRNIVDIDQDEGIELVVDQEKDAEVEGRHADKQAEIYNIDLDHSSKVLSMQEDDTEVVAASTPIPTAKPKILKIAAASAVSTRRRKGVVLRDPEEELHTDTLAETPTVKDKGKGILIEAPKPMKKKDQTREEIEKEDEEIIKSINETPTQKAAKRRKLSEEAQEADDLKKRLEILEVVADEDDDMFVEATPIGIKVPVVIYEVVMINNKPREDLEDLWKIVKARFSTSNPTNFTDDYLLVTLKNMFEKTNAQDVGISFETSVTRSPQQNDVIERRNRTLSEVARTMLIYAQASLFLWAEAVATSCYTQNHSIVRLHHGKTPYDLLHGKIPNLSFLYVFGALCYPTNDSEYLGKLQPKADIDFDELSSMASEQSSLGPVLHEMTPVTDLLFQPMFDELLTPPPSVDPPAPELIALIAKVVAPEPNASTGNDLFFGMPILEVASDQSSSTDSIHTIVHPDHQISEHNSKRTKDHPLENKIDQLARPVSTRLQLHERALFLYYDAFLTSVEPKTYKDALTQSCWIEAVNMDMTIDQEVALDEALVPHVTRLRIGGNRYSRIRQKPSQKQQNQTQSGKDQKRQSHSKLKVKSQSPRTLEDNFFEFMQINQFAEAVSSILGIVDRYLDYRMNKAVKVAVQLQSDKLQDEAQAKNKDFLNKLDENIQKIINEQVKEQVKVQVSKILPKIKKTVNEQLEVEVLTHASNSSKKSYAVAADLSKLELKKILIKKMESNKRRDDEDKDEEPSTSSDRGSKRRRALKEPELTSAPKEKASKTSGKSTEWSKSHQKTISESAPIEDPMQTTQDLEEPVYLEFKTGAADDQPVVKASQHPEWFSQQAKPPTPDRA
nr:hypothetical protein [Tanacetum cinerariifolium]